MNKLKGVLLGLFVKSEEERAKRNVQNAQSFSELATIIKENKERFQDKSGGYLPIVGEFIASAKEKVSKDKKEGSHKDVDSPSASYGGNSFSETVGVETITKSMGSRLIKKSNGHIVVRFSKAKYTKRWKGKDGRWQYEYPEEKKNKDKGWIEIILRVLKISKENLNSRIKKDFIESGAEKKGLTLDQWRYGVEEYFANKEKYDKKFSSEKPKEKKDKREPKKEKKKNSHGEVKKEKVVNPVRFVYNFYSKEEPSSSTKEDKYPDFPKVDRTFSIKSEGRKWMKISYPGKSFQYNLLKEGLDGYKVGDEISGTFAVEDKSDKYGTKINYYLVDDSSSQTVKDEYLKIKSENASRRNSLELDKWMGYIEEAADNGYLYKNGLDKLNSLNYKENKEISIRLDEAKKKIEKIKLGNEATKWMHYIEENINKFWYSKGESKVKEQINKMNSSGIDSSEYESLLFNLKDQYKESKETEKIEDKKRGVSKISIGSGYGGFPYIKDSVIRNTEANIEKGDSKYLYVISANDKYYKYDGLSFGVGEDNGYIYSAKVRPATNEESKDIEEYDKKQYAHKKDLTKIKRIKDMIREKGEIPDSVGEIKGETILDTQNIYGGGDWFRINNDEIWYVRNNGADGDDWSRNNVRTGGAGAIGWKIKNTKELEKEIKKISSAIEDYKEYKKTINNPNSFMAKSISKFFLRDGKIYLKK